MGSLRLAMRSCLMSDDEKTSPGASLGPTKAVSEAISRAEGGGGRARGAARGGGGTLEATAKEREGEKKIGEGGRSRLEKDAKHSNKSHYKAWIAGLLRTR